MNKYNDAINICMQVIGEQILEGATPITGIYEAEQAELLIETTKEEILSEGWSFNTDEDWTLTPDTQGYITAPADILRLDPSEESSNYIRKDGKLYNKDTKTYVFTAGVDCDIVWNTEFDVIPPIMQQYIVLKAARLLYQRLVGDSSMISILVNDEREAKLRVQLHEDEVNDYNIFDNTSYNRVISRTANPTGVRG